MIILNRAAPWEQKPPHGVEVDASHPLAAQLRGFWLLTEGIGASVVNLATPGLNDGALGGTTSPTWVQTERGPALNWANAGERVNCGRGAPFDNLTAETFEVLIYFGGTTGGSQRVIAKQDAGSLYNGITITSGGAVEWERACATQSIYIITPSSTVAAGGWYHIIGTFDSVLNDSALYINGVKATYSTQDPGIGALTDDSPYDLLLGNRADNARTFNGRILFARVFNMFCPPDVAAELYANPYGLVAPAQRGTLFSMPDLSRAPALIQASTPVLTPTAQMVEAQLIGRQIRQATRGTPRSFIQPAPIQITTPVIEAQIIGRASRPASRGTPQRFIQADASMPPVQALPASFVNVPRAAPAPATTKAGYAPIIADSPAQLQAIFDELIINVPRPAPIAPPTRAGAAPIIADTPWVTQSSYEAKLFNILRGTWRAPGIIQADAWQSPLATPEALFTRYPRSAARAPIGILISDVILPANGDAGAIFILVPHAQLRALPLLLAGVITPSPNGSEAILIAVPRGIANALRVPALIMADSSANALLSVSVVPPMPYLTFRPSEALTRFYGGLQARDVWLSAQEANLSARDAFLRARNTGE